MKMLRNLTIKMKLSLGFGAMVLIAVVLGGAGWLGIRAANRYGDLVEQATVCERLFQDCRRAEKDFALRGTEKDQGDTKNAEEKLKDSAAELEHNLTKLVALATDQHDREFAHTLQSEFKSYLASFQQQTVARHTLETAAQVWINLSGEMGKAFDLAMSEEIKPRIQALRESANHGEFAKWQWIESQFNEKVMKPLIMLRIRAIYFLFTKNDARWEEYQKEIPNVQKGLTDAKILASGNEALLAKLAVIEARAKEYFDTAAKYREAAQVEQKAQWDTIQADRRTTDIFARMRQDIVEDRNSASHTLQSSMTILSLAGLVIGLLLAFFQTRGITKPIGAVVAQQNKIAQGDISSDVDGALQSRGDEIGVLAQSLQAVSANLRRMLRDVTGGVQTLASSSTELSAIASQMAGGSQDTSSRSATVAAASEELSANAASVAAGMEQMTANLSSVAAATEEMSATIGEIASNSEKARSISATANEQAQGVAALMKQLGAAAQEIGKVTETITSISAQTNLLALNATIEAARAGAAGKGFAVVANEIKELAQQTAQATEEIKGRIAGVQTSTGAAMADVDKIAGVIQEVGGIVVTIATSIEEQTSVTRDMARNLAEASSGVNDANQRVSQTAGVSQEIARDIAGVNTAAGEIASGSQQVQVSAQELSQLAESLKAMVGQFKL